MHTLDADGRWLIPVGTLSAFVKTAKVPNCPVQSHALVLAHTSVRPAATAEFCLFYGAAIALARNRNRVAVPLQKGEVVTAQGCMVRPNLAVSVVALQARVRKLLCARKSVAHARVWSH